MEGYATRTEPRPLDEPYLCAACEAWARAADPKAPRMPDPNEAKPVDFPRLLLQHGALRVVQTSNLRGALEERGTDALGTDCWRAVERPDRAHVELLVQTICQLQSLVEKLMRASLIDVSDDPALARVSVVGANLYRRLEAKEGS
jgi:hypothetical protein